MYNPNSNMAATLSQFVNPADSFIRNITGPGGILSEQINRMTKGENQGLATIDTMLDNSFKDKRAKVADEQWGKELSLKERALAIQAANAKRARDKAEAEGQADVLALQAYMDPNATATYDVNQDVVNKPLLAKTLTEAGGGYVPLTEDEVYKVAQDKAKERLAQEDPNWNTPGLNPGQQILKASKDTVRDLANSTGTGSGLIGTLLQLPALYDKVTAPGDSPAQAFDKDTAPKQVIPQETPLSKKILQEELDRMKEFETKRKADYTTSIVDKIDNTVVDYNKPEMWKEGIFKTVTKTMDRPTQQRMAPGLKLLKSMPDGSAKKAFAGKLMGIAKIYQDQAATRAKPAQELSLYKSKKNIDLNYEKQVKLLDTLITNNDPNAAMLKALELKEKILGNKKLEKEIEEKIEKIKDMKGFWG